MASISRPSKTLSFPLVRPSTHRIGRRRSVSLCQLLASFLSRCCSSASLSILQNCNAFPSKACVTRRSWRCHRQSNCLLEAALSSPHRPCRQDTSISCCHCWARVSFIHQPAPRCLCSTRMRRLGEALQRQLRDRPASHYSLVSSHYSSTSMDGLETRAGHHLQAAGDLLLLDCGLSPLSCHP